MNEKKEVWLVENHEDGIVGVYTSMKKLYDRIEAKKADVEHYSTGKVNVKITATVHHMVKELKLTYANVRIACQNQLWFPVTFEILNEYNQLVNDFEYSVTSVILDR